MYVATGRTSPTRFAVVSMLMLAVLLVSLGVAWWMVRRHPATRGATLLAQVRRDGLGAYWRGSSDHGRLRRLRDGRVVGWRATVRRAGGGGRPEKPSEAS